MQIRVGYELVYDCPQPTPMVLMLTIHHSRAADLVAPDPLAEELAASQGKQGWSHKGTIDTISGSGSRNVRT
jgi:hypothetical protein